MLRRSRRVSLAFPFQDNDDIDALWRLGPGYGITKAGAQIEVEPITTSPPGRAAVDQCTSKSSGAGLVLCCARPTASPRRREPRRRPSVTARTGRGRAAA